MYDALRTCTSSGSCETREQPCGTHAVASLGKQRVRNGTGSAGRRDERIFFCRRNAETNTAMANDVGHKVTRESKFRGSRRLAWRGSHGLAGDQEGGRQRRGESRNRSAEARTMSVGNTGAGGNRASRRGQRQQHGRKAGARARARATARPARRRTRPWDAKRATNCRVG